MNTRQEYVIPVLRMGDRLRIVRREYLSKISQADMAALLGVPRERYAQWESGNSEPRSPEARRIASMIQDHTGVSAAWILGVQDSGPITDGDGGLGAPWPVSKVLHLSDYRMPA